MGRTAIAAAAIATVSIGAMGCAGVRVYSDPAMTHETGVRVFAPKPYLLVSRTGARDQPVELSIVYLPDTRDALYIRQQRGWGSNDLGVRMTNGILTDIGTRSDSRMPETVDAAGSLLRAAAGAYKTSPLAPTLGSRSAPRNEVDSASRMLALIGQELLKVTSGSSAAMAPQAAAAREIADTLNSVSAALADPAQAADLDLTLARLSALIAAIDGLKMESPPTGNNRVTVYNSRIETLKSQLQRVMEKIGAPEPVPFELYEIRQQDGRTELVRVDIGR